ncbi:hypothetical protein E3T54_03730 [Cryobacterium sp. Sr8]|uniref:Uncharacterized protein n=1 Tax=Cryobacterium psychrotolerans TaxID=386301 RepID=A0A1G9AH32_9MICO|nr:MULTISPECIES: hypothetical protein [Cryobacterium]TFD44764.1 hypothetical protein E3T33_08050 [Cryobacterium sp. TMT1-2-1]TFD80345.1 hypothetical protein E3T54_03730 [Cryobacterium sp. Sr8]TFD89657.1 hypothetical protein E3T56_02980 [Cryobacterium psychrotolerans]SDK26676.1 hypothetical protein SAMN05216282_104114 [Cryobacterium psychrotolerans]
MMASDPDALWPRRPGLGSEGVDENREVDDTNLTLDEDLAGGEDENDEWATDADERPVDLDREDREDRDEDRDQGEEQD